MRRRSRKSQDGGAMLLGGPDSPLPLHSALRCRLSPALGDHLSVALRNRLSPRLWGSPLCCPSEPSLPHPWGPPTLLSIELNLLRHQKWKHKRRDWGSNPQAHRSESMTLPSRHHHFLSSAGCSSR